MYRIVNYRFAFLSVDRHEHPLGYFLFIEACFEKPAAPVKPAPQYG